MLNLPPGMGWVEVITGCMFSGKTDEIIRRLRQATHGKQKVVSFKPTIDDRSVGIASHSGQSLDQVPIISVKFASQIHEFVGDAQVIGIDEGQFLEGLSEVAHDLANGGKRVIITGLDMDYRGLPFGPIPSLMATAEFVDKLYAVCMVCGGLASRSQRISNSDEQVLIGAAGVYEARCRLHWSPQPVFSADRHMDRLED